MVLQSTRWLSLSYFTYFFSYGIFLPFWGIWLQGEGIPPETIGILLGAGLIARFLGSLLIAPSVKDPSHLVTAIRILALLTLVFVVGFCFGNGWAWLMVVIAGFNLFFGPLVPLTDALAGTWQKQITMDYGKVRLWGSLAFVIGSALTGKLVSVWGHPAILYSLIFGVSAMLLGALLKPNVMPQGEVKHRNVTATSWKVLLSDSQVWRFLLCVTLLQGAHAGYYSFSSIYWKDAGYSAATIGYLWSLGVVAEILVFAFSNVLFRRWTARGLLLLSAITGIIRWSLMASTTELPWLILIQILHCGSFTVCHLAAMRFIAARRGPDVIRLQSVYSALAMGGGIAVMTVISGFLFEHYQGGVFWVMALIVIPALFIRPRVIANQEDQTG
ncbi:MULTISPECIES: 3-phenylpropionate MFS transporter [Yersinia]|uniref:3-phenylpropionate MFS transporter n=1 Tax=Yersinia TaxID=629 RepID=UPI0005E948F9|nr:MULTISPECIES: 3-phenylpropionate MFS transporter [Yersinia]MDN0104823.1 3-phenylpropionate MFS transporter [Yersinia bercovieri]QDW32584.1 3-phenylpropionate MFS transporter [Yersinia sp. KBS0713]CNI23884.1 putative 3-phenylpropionic acid transporter [Yersinia bercovieri]